MGSQTLASLDLRRLGSMLRAARERHSGRLTVRELAGITGIAESVVTSYETGARQPTLLNLWKLATVLGLDMNEVRRRTLIFAEQPSEDPPEDDVPDDGGAV